MKDGRKTREKLRKVRRVKDGEVYRPMIDGKPRRDWTLINDTGMVKLDQGWKREIIAKAEIAQKQDVFKQVFRIVVHLDAYVAQSRAQLFILARTREWTYVASRNPGNEYPDVLLSTPEADRKSFLAKKQFTAYTPSAEGHEFDIVIADLMDIAERLAPAIEE